MQGSNPNSLKGLKIGWETAKLRKDPRNNKTCVICGKSYSRRGKKKFTAKCCSRECCAVYRTGLPSPKKGIFHKIEKICKCGKKFRIFPSELKKTNRPYCSWACSKKFNKGKNHTHYKGGKQAERNAIYHSKKYKNWRMKVFVRDNFTCLECSQVGGELEAHHIKPQALFPELRFRVKNGATLCKPCHKKTESWLRYYGKKTQKLRK
jgi:5-methylcytosine-specific restriction endonuclease McrA